VEVFFCDSDNPGHAAWTPEALPHSVYKEEDALRPLATAGAHYTAHGRRIVQPIAEPIPVTHVERFDGSNVGACVRSRMRDVTVTPFDGDAQAIHFVVLAAR
jgi:hypothetical protein